jgi:F0F1-type ATP synthase membrane subunit c/vacuolar-type H+-ATPase subunit K
MTNTVQLAGDMLPFFKGDKGDPGDVTPEATALLGLAVDARDAAQLHAIAASKSAMEAQAVVDEAAQAVTASSEETTVSIATNLINTQTLIALMIAAQ